MCRLLNNLAEIAVRVLEQHLGVHERLQRLEAQPPGSAGGVALAALKDKVRRWLRYTYVGVKRMDGLCCCGCIEG